MQRSSAGAQRVLLAGMGNEAEGYPYSVHSPKADFDESAMPSWAPPFFFHCTKEWLQNNPVISRKQGPGRVPGPFTVMAGEKAGIRGRCGGSKVIILSLTL